MMKLTENAFAVLGAMPGDNRTVLNDKADEAALLGGEDTEGALNQLMQMNRRIPAELSWFPGATPEAADAFLAYARAAAEGQPGRIPPVDDLGSALAQANALSALFEMWPTDDPELFIALCRTMDGILSQITAEDTLQAVNADREAGRWETVPDAHSLSEPLSNQLRALCAPVATAVDRMGTNAAASALKTLFGQNGIDVQGNVAQTAADAYSMLIHDRSEKLREEINKEAVPLGDAPTVSKVQVSALRQKVQSWCDLTAPLRLMPGATRNAAKGVAQNMRNVVVNYVNKAGTVQKQETVFISSPSANVRDLRTATITYQSQSEKVDYGREMTKWLKESFAEQVDFITQLKSDEGVLSQMMRNENNMLIRARADAEAKYSIGRRR